jgi:hypothetical protein
LSATSLGQYFAAHQHAVSVEVTNVIGSPGPVYLFGARVLAILPIVGPVGNMGPVLCAFSYAGQLFLVVTADAHGFPDLDVLMAGMETEGRALLGGGCRLGPVVAGSAAALRARHVASVERAGRRDRPAEASGMHRMCCLNPITLENWGLSCCSRPRQKITTTAGR